MKICVKLNKLMEYLVSAVTVVTHPGVGPSPITKISFFNYAEMSSCQHQE